MGRIGGNSLLGVAVGPVFLERAGLTGNVEPADGGVVETRGGVTANPDGLPARLPLPISLRA